MGKQVQRKKVKGVQLVRCPSGGWVAGLRGHTWRFAPSKRGSWEAWCTNDPTALMVMDATLSLVVQIVKRREEADAQDADLRSAPQASLAFDAD